jgi:hypothetical protein
MNSADRNELLVRFNCNLAADPTSLILFETNSGLRLPSSYSDFLKRANGGEGFIGKAYTILWRVEELLDKNKAYEVAKYAPGLMLFGSDGGGEALAFDTRTDATPIVSVPFVGMTLGTARPIAPTFERFLETLSKS